MDITKWDLYGGTNIGLYAAVADSYLLVPSGFAAAKAERLAQILEVGWHAISICGTRLLGSMSVHCNNRILLPKTVHEPEYTALCSITESVHILNLRYTALGNLICANRHGAIISPLFTAAERHIIQDALDTEVAPTHIAGLEQTGALAATNDTGTVVHPLADQDEIEYISQVLKTKVEPSTINAGVPYVTTGILLNNMAVVVGSTSTGPEIMMLTRAFL